MKKVMHRLMVSLPDRSNSLLRIWAKKEGMSLSGLMAFIIKKALDEEEQAGRLNIDSNN